jgi:beta-phosphoglucomutase-like phosphatase (HAD superfamily)
MSERNAAAVLGDTRCILLDFDGPVCSIFAGVPAAEVAERLRQLLTAQGVPIPAHMRRETDPLAVFRLAATHGETVAAQVEAALRDAEITAIASAAATPGSSDFRDACQRSGHTVAIVSNNSQAAVDAYVDAHGLREQFRAVIGRVDADPTLTNEAKPASRAARTPPASRRTTGLRHGWGLDD